MITAWLTRFMGVKRASNLESWDEICLLRPMVVSSPTTEVTLLVLKIQQLLDFRVWYQSLLQQRSSQFRRYKMRLPARKRSSWARSIASLQVNLKNNSQNNVSRLTVKVSQWKMMWQQVSQHRQLISLRARFQLKLRLKSLRKNQRS